LANKAKKIVIHSSSLSTVASIHHKVWGSKPKCRRISGPD